LAAALHRHQRVLEGGRGRVVGDGAHLLQLDAHACVEGGREIRVADAVELRKVEWQRTRREEGVGRRVGGVQRGSGEHGGEQRGGGGRGRAGIHVGTRKRN